VILLDVVIAKIDKFGRIVIPAKWRRELFGEGEAMILLIKRDHSIELRPVPSRNLEEFFDAIDLGVDEIKDWAEFERKFYGGEYEEIS